MGFGCLVFFFSPSFDLHAFSASVPLFPFLLASYYNLNQREESLDVPGSDREQRGEARERVDGEGGGRGLTKAFIYFFPKLLISFMFWGTFIYALVCLCSVLVRMPQFF